MSNRRARVAIVGTYQLELASYPDGEDTDPGAAAAYDQEQVRTGCMTVGELVWWMQENGDCTVTIELQE